MLSTIGRLLNARSVSCGYSTTRMTHSFAVMSEGGKLGALDPEHPSIKNPLFWKQNAIIEELLFTAGPVVCDDVATDPRINGEWGDYFERKGTKRFLAVPILVGGQVRGLSVFAISIVGFIGRRKSN